MDNDVVIFGQVMLIIVLSLAGIVVIGLTARFLWRLGSRSPKRPEALADRREMQRLETAVESIAVEVERISESQRFMVSLLAKRLPGDGEEAATALHRPRVMERTITPH